MASRGIVHIAHLRIRCTQQTGKLLPVGGGLIEHQQKLGVCKHHTRRIGQQTFLHILCDAGERRTVFTETLPALVEEFAAVIGNAVSAAAPVGEKQIDLVDVDMGIFSLSAVLNDAVIDGVQHHQQAHRFQIFTQILNVKAEDTAFCVDIGLVGEHIQTAHREQLQRQRNAVRLRVDLLHQIIVKIFQRRRLALIVFQILPVDVAHAAVNDGLLLRLDLIRAHKLLVERHDMVPFCILAIENEDDREFMTRLYLDYSRLMQQQITKIVQDEWAAEDLMQTTLVKLIDKVQDLRTKDRNHLINYIISACKNQARNYMRDKNRHAEYSIDEYLDTPNPHDGADEIEMRLAYTDELEHLSKVWPKLDGRSRYLLESHYILEKSPYEIAANLGIKPDSVRMALTRARKAAYALLAKE